MRLVILALALLGCGDPYVTAQQSGTIDAFETYLAENPDGRYRLQAESQLETMYLEEASTNPSLEAYDRYLERWPKARPYANSPGRAREVPVRLGHGERKEPAWDRFLREYPRASPTRLKNAKRAKAVSAYVDSLSWTDLKIYEINLAENPDGPEDGWAFEMDVTNNGTRTIEDLRFTFQPLSKHDRPLSSTEWPVVAERWPIPMEEDKKVPMKPGETRTWLWTTAPPDPEKWAGKAKVTPAYIRLAR